MEIPEGARVTIQGYRINASDFMRRAIAESVVAHRENMKKPDQKFVFV
tara:strand:- start:212 stop:355 length:144 start_codon:yes stop_codon:yes gene_type:complete